MLKYILNKEAIFKLFGSFTQVLFKRNVCALTFPSKMNTFHFLQFQLDHQKTFRSFSGH